MIPSIANIRKAIYCLNKRLDLLEGGEYSSTVTQLSNKVAALESLLDDDILNPTTVIDKFNEIVAFLNSIENTDTLSGLLLDIISLIPDAQILSDWNQVNSNAKDFIKNKPTIPINTGKADKVTNAVSGNLAGLDTNGNLTDSGVAINEVIKSTSVRTVVILTQVQYDALVTKDANTEYNIIESV